MVSRSTRILAATALGLAALASPGCTSDPVESSTAALSVRFVPSPSGVGRYNEATLNINKIGFEPADPSLVPLMGGESFAMRFGVYTADLSATEPDEYAAIGVTPGTYRITDFTFRPPLLQDGEASQSAPECIERISLIPSGPAASQVPVTYTLDASDGLSFTVAAGQTRVDIVVDVPGLLEAYEAAFTCSESCGGGNACLTAFDVDAFRAAFVAHVSIQ